VTYAQGAMNPPARPRSAGVCCNDNCRYANACEATRGGDPALLDMRDVVERAGPFADGDRLVQPEAPHRAAFAVLTGFAKTVAHGRVLAFHLPGELFALDVSRNEKHATSIVAVGKTWFCRFPRSRTDALCDRNGELAGHLRALRRRERRTSGVLADGGAASRMRIFLLDLLRRRRLFEGESRFIPLPMSREDIASCLGMSAATVTRMLARLRAEGVIAIRPDGLDVLDECALAASASDP